jgi:hypothetical protein
VDIAAGSRRVRKSAQLLRRRAVATQHSRAAREADQTDGVSLASSDGMMVAAGAVYTPLWRGLFARARRRNHMALRARRWHIGCGTARHGRRISRRTSFCPTSAVVASCAGAICARSARRTSASSSRTATSFRSGLLRSITAAARRGVAVTSLVPGRSDVPVPRATTALVYRRLLAAGVRVFEPREWFERHVARARQIVEAGRAAVGCVVSWSG